ncbi:hypothetical protein F3N42_03800 [Marinihelvus fidelis]|uniref:Uncharacterized protein n=1 Tax=Marinihelvus fidelis TaxID=2613842 RepID=A0A5N0TEL2_9GAMM|nr:hypothetical protein [Marinihelvus fidelis]KAA9133485.1 hypothetical protein F3N42_03800 [Marinihelvus fidelis]
MSPHTKEWFILVPEARAMSLRRYLAEILGGCVMLLLLPYAVPAAFRWIFALVDLVIEQVAS